MNYSQPLPGPHLAQTASLFFHETRKTYTFAQRISSFSSAMFLHLSHQRRDLLSQVFGLVFLRSQISNLFQSFAARDNLVPARQPSEIRAKLRDTSS